jgi:hypothetical protein
MELSASDKREFIAYLKVCTDRQVEGVFEKESEAGRNAYADLAKQELRNRGIA